MEIIEDDSSRIKESYIRGGIVVECDVIIPTWNSDKYLESAIKSIKEDTTLPLNKIIIVDRLSIDKTIEIAKRYGCEIIYDGIGLGSARKKGIAEASTEWIAFIDSDCVIYDGWYGDMSKYIGNGVGGFCGLTLPTCLPRELLMKEYKKKFVNGAFAINGTDYHAYTNCTLIKRKLLLDIDLSPFSGCEDTKIGEHIMDKGYKWLIVPVFIEHLDSIKNRWNKARWGWANARYHKTKSLKYTLYTLLTYFLDGFVNGVRNTIRYKDFNCFKIHLTSLYGLQGYLFPKKYVDYRRD